MKPWNIFNTFFTSKEKLLTEKEQTWANIVYPFVVDEIEKQQRKNDAIELCDININFEEKVELTRENFKYILDLFESLQKSRDAFLKCYPWWSKLRNENTQQLNAIVEAMHTDKFNSNISRLTGSVVGACGGTALAAVAVCPVTAPVAISAFVACTLGGLTVGGTAACEHVLLKTRIDKAKQILEQDQDNFQCIAKWFEHTKEFMEAFESVLGIDLSRDMFEGLEHLPEDFRAARDFGSSDRVQELLTRFRPVIQAMCSLSRFNSGGLIGLAPVVITFFFIVVLLHKRNRALFDCVLLTHRLLFGLLSSVDAGIELGTVVTALALKGTATAVSKTAARSMARGVFAGIGVGLDLANIVLTSRDIQKGSLSKHGNKIKEAVEKLREEHSFLQQVYNELK